ncbi:MAG: Ig-like domain-containing protein [Panacagrimonas sp.]
MKRIAAVLATLASMVLSGCGDSIQSPDFTSELLEIRLLPATPVTLAAGRTVQLGANGLYSTPPGEVDPSQDNGADGFLTAADGTVLRVAPVDATYASSNTAAATVDATGLVTTVATGVANITASSGSRTSNPVVVTVTGAVLDSIVIDPATASVSLTRTQRFNAVGTFSDGSTDGVIVNWVSEDTTIATLTPATGESTVATSLAEGVADITATFPASALSEGRTLSASATLNVTPFEPVLVAIGVTPLDASIPVGLMQQFTATGTFSTQTPNVTTQRALTESDAVVWSLDGTGSSFASVDAVRGIVTGNAQAQNVSVRATVGEVSGATTFDVSAPVFVSITVNPPTASIALGTTILFSATGTLSNGMSMPVQADWTSADPTIATLAPSAGVVTTTATAVAISAAPIDITASFDADADPATPAITGTATLSVTDAVISGLLRLAPPVGRVTIGRSVEFVAIGSFTDGTEKSVDDSLVTWSLLDAQPDPDPEPNATVAADGTASGLNVGVSTVTATLVSTTGITGQTSASARLTVTDRVCTTPLLASEGAVATEERSVSCIGCRVRDLDNLTNSVTDDIATISLPVALIGANAGVRVDANANPSYTLPFAAGNNAGFLVTQPAGLLAIAELLSTVQVSTLLGDTVQESTGALTPLRVELLGAEVVGGLDSETALVSIATSQPYDAIRLTLNGGAVSALASLGVSAACGTVDVPEPASPLERIERIEPLNSTIVTGATTNLVAIGRYVDGTEQRLSDADLDWTSLNSAVASVDANGLVTGTVAGSATIQAALKTGVTSTTAARTATANLTVIDSACTTPFLASEGATVSSSTSALCLLCNITELPNVIDGSPTTAARIGVNLGLLNGSATIRVDNEPTSPDLPPGQTTGFVIGRPPGGLLLAEALAQIDIEVLNNGVVVERTGPRLPLRLQLLGGLPDTGDETGLASITPTVGYDAIQITFKSGLVSGGLQNNLANLRVFQACAAASPPPP